METNCSYIQVEDHTQSGGWKRYRFKRENNILSFFNISYDQDTPISCDAVPFVSLIPQ